MHVCKVPESYIQMIMLYQHYYKTLDTLYNNYMFTGSHTCSGGSGTSSSNYCNVYVDCGDCFIAIPDIFC